MKKNDYRAVKLQKGEVRVYDFGGLKLHACQTNDPIADEVFILEKDRRAVVIEAPCFTDSIAELSGYISDSGMQVEALLLSYHMAGAGFLPGVPVYSTQNAADYGHIGGGRALIDSFSGAFGAVFDASVYTVTNIIEPGPLELAGFALNIVPTADAFDIEIPEMGAAYIHMLGHDCHSIVAGAGHANVLIAQLKDFIARGFDLILTSHHTPEDLKDAQTKIDYLENLKSLAAGATGAEDLRQVVQQKYPAYVGENYLDMTVGFFFPM